MPHPELRADGPTSHDPPPTFLIGCLRLRLRLLLRADPLDDRLLLQQVAPRDRLGRLLDPMVRQAARRTTRSSTPPSCRCRSPLVSATFATILGTMAGMALARFRRFRGRTVFSGLVTAPLVMPEVITGISMLMLFILMAQLIGWPGQRGFTTITIAHITFSMSYVATIVRVAPRLDGRLGRGGRHGPRLAPVEGAARPSPCRSSRRRSSPAGCSPSPSRSTTW